MERYRADAAKVPVFFEGQLHHVGDCYDLATNGRDLRVVVVGQEYGHGPAQHRRESRSEDIAVATGRRRRFFSEQGRESRNPHMRGTTSVLRLLVGHQAGADYDGEFIEVDGHRRHLFEAFALVNFLLCSAIEDDREALADEGRKHTAKSGRSTPVMQWNCGRHFKATLAILQPTVMVVQGVGVSGWIRAAGVFTRETVLSPTLSRAVFGDHEILVAHFAHPSARFPDNWGTNDRTPYLLGVVVPTVEAIRSSLRFR